MMYRIRVTPEELFEEIKALRDCKMNHDDAISKIDSIVNGLLEDWHSNAQRAFVDSYNNKKKEFEAFSADIEAWAKFAEDFAIKMYQEEWDRMHICKLL